MSPIPISFPIIGWKRKAVMVLTSCYAVCASPSIREAITKTVQPRAGRNLRLMIFDLDIFHTRGEDEDLPDSIQSTIGDC